MAMLILSNGRNDNLIPYPESLAPAAAMPEAQACSWPFRRENLHDLWRPAHD